MKIVIVGGVAAGMSAATRLRRLQEDAEIIVFDKGPYVSFANCGLPYHISGEIAERSSLIVQSPKSLKQRFNIDVRPLHEVISIQAENKTITVRNAEETFTESFDKLILAPGAIPFIPPLKGFTEADNIFTLRNILDLDNIMEAIKNKQLENAVIIGAGFIGLEMVENLSRIGLNITLLEKAPQVLPALDKEMAAFVERELRANNIKVITNQAAQALEDAGKTIVLEDGTRLKSDLTILSVGIKPNTEFIKSSGIELGLRDGIIVDNQYRTNFPDIYAVGDAIIVKNQVSQKDDLIALASPANRQGRQVADIISGVNSCNKGSIGTAILRIFNLTTASTGLNERMAKKLALDYQVIHGTYNNHAGYFPGKSPIILKLVFDRSNGKIYGAQAIGKEGVDKRIDVLSTAIKAGLNVYDLQELELAYAPPFSSAKDPVNMLGYAAANLLDGFSESIQWYELEDELSKGKVLLDFREISELERNGKFKAAINIPLSSLRDNLDKLDKNQAYVLTCHSTVRSYFAERLLKQLGFDVVNLDGSFSIYSAIKPEDIEKFDAKP